MIDTKEELFTMINIRIVLCLLSIIFINACTIWQKPAPMASACQECQDMFDLLDKIILSVDGQNMASHPVKGYSFLRTNRFLSELFIRAKTKKQKLYVISKMQRLDISERKKEILNLSVSNRRAIGLSDEDPSPDTIMARLVRCSHELKSNAINQNNFWDTIERKIKVPDEYSTLMRVFGGYPFAALPVMYLTKKAQKHFYQWHQSSNSINSSEVQIYKPSRSVHAVWSTLIKQLYEPSNLDDFGLPQVSQNQKHALAEVFAPIFFQQDHGLFDRPSKLIWESSKPKFLTDTPAVYYYFSNTFIHDRPVLQINYTLWYTKRTGNLAPSIEHGPIDGLTIRITLSPKGYPVILDSMNSCGCYHFFVPNPTYVQRINELSFGKAAFVPSWLPETYPNNPVGIHIISGWHQINKISSVNNLGKSETYKLIPYEELENIADDSGQTSNFFGSNGIAKNGERSEYLLLFPMGIHNVGSMRQRGHHAVTLVGRTHFDDANFFDLRFVFKNIE